MWRGVGFLLLSAIDALDKYFGMSVGCEMGIDTVTWRQMVYPKYLEGGPRSRTVYLDFSMQVNESIGCYVRDVTRKSSFVTHAVIVPLYLF